MVNVWDIYTPAEFSLIKMLLVHCENTSTQEQLKKDCADLLKKMNEWKRG